MTDGVRFAHASEAELARILDYYGVRWQYEPRTFPILWNLDGKVVESFSPDFYLPDMDLYVELTTLKQSLVRRKNRKLRRLKELYPDVRAKLFYGKDFRALMLKYGRFDVAASLSGLEGQLMPDRTGAAVRAPHKVAPPPRVQSRKPVPVRLPVALPLPVAASVPVAKPLPIAQPSAAAAAAAPRPGFFAPLRRRISRGGRRRRGRRAFIACAGVAGGES